MTEKEICGNCKYITVYELGFACPIIAKKVSYTGRTCSKYQKKGEVKSTEIIDKEIENVKKQFDNVESIIGELACETGRHRLVHRELRTFTWFVGFMIFSRAEEGASDYDLKFKKEYVNFRLGEGSDAEDLYKWACLYWIYCNNWFESEEYKKLEEMEF